MDEPMYNIMLTTHDNPFNPFDDFTSWYLYDMSKGYDCSGRLMRVAQITDDLSSIEIDEELERAIDQIIFNDCLNVYKKIKKELVNVA